MWHLPRGIFRAVSSFKKLLVRPSMLLLVRLVVFVATGIWAATSWVAQTGCHPQAIVQWDLTLKKAKKTNNFGTLLDSIFNTKNGDPTENAEFNTKNGDATESGTYTRRGNLRRLDDNEEFSNYWTETGGMCVDIQGKKVSHYQYNAKMGRHHHVLHADCKNICEHSKGCEGFAIKLAETSGQLWIRNCSLYGERVVPPFGFEYVAADGRSNPVRGEFPESGPNYPVRCFVRTSGIPVVHPGRSAELKAKLNLKKEQKTHDFGALLDLPFNSKNGDATESVEFSTKNGVATTTVTAQLPNAFDTFVNDHFVEITVSYIVIVCVIVLCVVAIVVSVVCRREIDSVAPTPLEDWGNAPVAPAPVQYV